MARVWASVFFVFFPLWLWRPCSAPLWRAQCEQSSWGEALTWPPGKEQAHAPSVSPRLSPSLPSPLVFPLPSPSHMDKQPRVQVAPHSLSFSTRFACHGACTFPSILPPPLLSSPCVCLCSSSSSCLIFLETNYRALQEEKKREGEQFRQRASRLLPSHFHEDLFFSLQDLFFSLTSLYICLCPSFICIPLFSPLILVFYASQISNQSLNPPVISSLGCGL